MLNRVIGNSSSEIFGQLLSNGAVYLINPNGVVIGPSGYVETAGFIASTLDLFKGDLDENTFRFQGDSQNGVVNEGTIRCSVGDIYLIGRTVENSGSLITENGIQQMLSGCDVLVRPGNAPAVLIRSGDLADDESFEENPYALAIRHTGESIGKEIYLSAEKGSTEVAGSLVALGGTVHVLGDLVHLQEGTLIDVSHETGGGTILIGGDYQGQNPIIKSATRTLVAKGAKLSADALQNGNGGKVIVWGDESTDFYGEISAKGGSRSGNGGFVEISGKLLAWHGPVDTSAARGKTGTLLLDPWNVTISTDETQNDTLSLTTFVPTGISSANIQVSELEEQLAKTNVTIVTAGEGLEGGSIIVYDPISWSSPTTLTLTADRDIEIYASITNSSKENFTAMKFTALGNDEESSYTGITVAASLSAQNGAIHLHGTSQGTTGACHGILLSEGTITTSGPITLTGISGPSDTASIGVYFAGGMIYGNENKICITGISHGTASGSHGIYLPISDWNISTKGLVAFVGSTVDPAPNSFAIVAPASFTTGGPLTFNGAVGVGTKNSTATTITSVGPLLFSSTLDGVSNGANDLTLRSGTSPITLTSSVGGNRPLGKFNIPTGPTNLILGSTASSVIASAFSVGVIPTSIHFVGTVNVDTSAAGGDISFGSTMSGVAPNAHSMILSAGTGNVSFAHNIGSEALPFGAFTISNAAQAFFAGAVTDIFASSFTTGSSVRSVFQGTGSTTINTSRTSGNIWFGGKIDGEVPAPGPGHDLTLVTGGGDVLFGGNIGETIELGALSISQGANSVSLANNLYIMNVASFEVGMGISTTVGCKGMTTITTSGSAGMFFGGLLRGTSTGKQDLMLVAKNGPITFLGNIGSYKLGHLTIATGATRVSFGSFLDTINANALTIGSNVPTFFNFAGTTTITTTAAPGIYFGGPINGLKREKQNLVLIGSGAGPVIFQENVGASIRLGNLSITSATGVIFGESASSLSATSFSVGPYIPTTFSFAGTTTILTTGAGGIFLGGTLNGVSPTKQNANFIADCGPVSFLNTIGATVPLGDFLVSTARDGLSFGVLTTTIDANTFTIGTGIKTTLIGATATTLTTHSKTAGDISFGGTLNGSVSEKHSLTLTSSGAGRITFAETVGDSYSLKDFTITAAHDVTAAGSFITSTLTQQAGTGTSTFNGSVTTKGAVLLTGTDFAFNSPVDTGSGDILWVGTDVRFNESVNTGSGDISLTGRDAAFNGPINTGSGNILFTGRNIVANGPIDTGSGNISVTATDVAFNGSVDTGASDISLNCALGRINGTVHANDVTIDHSDLLVLTSAGNLTLTGSFLQTGPGTVETAGGIKASGEIFFASPVYLIGSIDLRANLNTTFSSTVDGKYGLTVSAANLIFSDFAGKKDALASIVASASTILITKDHTVCAGPMSYTGPVTLTSTHTTFTNTGVNPTIFDAGSGVAIKTPFDCTIISHNSSISIDGAVDLSGDDAHPNGGHFIAHAGSDLTINGDISTRGDVIGGNVLCASISGSISVKEINTSGDSFGGNISLKASSGYANGLPLGRIFLNGNLTALPLSSSGGEILLDARRVSPSTVATIVGNSDISMVGKSIEMGVNEAMTIFGNGSLDCLLLTLSDIVAIGDLSIEATTIQLNTRGMIPLLNKDGVLYPSPVLHCCAGGAYSRKGTLVPSSGPFEEQSYALSSDDLFSSSNSLFLNFDSNLTEFLIAQSIVDLDPAQFIMYKITVADAQLSDMLPIYRVWPPRYNQRRKAP